MSTDNITLSFAGPLKMCSQFQYTTCGWNHDILHLAQINMKQDFV